MGSLNKSFYPTAHKIPQLKVFNYLQASQSIVENDASPTIKAESFNTCPYKMYKERNRC